MCSTTGLLFSPGQVELELPQAVAEGRSLQRHRRRSRQVALPPLWVVLARLCGVLPWRWPLQQSCKMSLVSLGPIPQSHCRVQQNLQQKTCGSDEEKPRHPFSICCFKPQHAPQAAKARRHASVVVFQTRASHSGDWLEAQQRTPARSKARASKNTSVEEILESWSVPIKASTCPHRSPSVSTASSC